MIKEDFDGLQQAAGLLEGVFSQVLLLRDALDTGDDEKVVHAFALVSRLCGLDVLAAMAGCDRNRLLEALADGMHPNIAALSYIVDQLLYRCTIE